MASPICPCCGYNIEAEQPIVAGRFTYSPARGFLVDGDRLKVAPDCHAMIGAVMAAAGTVVRREALAERQNEEFAHPMRAVNGFVWRLREALARLDIEPPFERVPCVGVRWCGPPVERAAAAAA